jgi:hypothetical protein
VDGHGRRPDWKKQWRPPHRKTSAKRRSGQFESERGVEMDTIVLSTKRLFKAEIPPFAVCRPVSKPPREAHRDENVTQHRYDRRRSHGSGTRD